MQPETRKLLRFVWLLLEKTQPGDGNGKGWEAEAESKQADPGAGGSGKQEVG